MQTIIEQLKDAIKNGSVMQAEVLTALAEAQDVHEFNAEITAARKECNDELEIDDFPLVSPSDDGVWVSAWIWVPRDDETTSCHECGNEMFIECSGVTHHGTPSEIDYDADANHVAIADPE